MKLFLAEPRGFCYGVKRAVSMAEKCAGNDEKVVTYGPIIHNPQVVKQLQRQGIGMIDSLAEIDAGTVIIRSHGVGPEIYKEAEERGLRLVDATCPHVRKAQASAKKLFDEGYQVVVVGERKHPEVRSIVAWAGNNALVVETSGEAAGMPFVDKMGVVAQTTFPVSGFDEIVSILHTKTSQLKVGRTICNATELRQQAAIDLAAKVSVMVVVGGKNSANTTHLAELCRQAGAATYHIETAEELVADWFRGANTVGITAGASTPDWIIEEVVKQCMSLTAS